MKILLKNVLKNKPKNSNSIYVSIDRESHRYNNTIELMWIEKSYIFTSDFCINFFISVYIYFTNTNTLNYYYT